MWTKTDFGGIFKIIQIYERYDSSNKMQIEQHWVIGQTVPYSEQQVVRKNNRTWKMAKWDFALIHVRKEMEEGWMPQDNWLRLYKAREQRQQMFNLRNLF